MDNRKKIKNEEFFLESADKVAKMLLGKILCRSLIDNSGRMKIYKARIVETEAYFSGWDPASRASNSRKDNSKGKTNKVAEVMFLKPGKILIYNVHMYQMLNFVCREEGKAEAVLIRALEPVNFSGRCSGPGLLTRCLNIDKDFNKCSVLDNGRMWLEYIEEKNNGFNLSEEEIVKSYRVGVTKDLPEKYRFYIKGNKFISKK